MTDMLGGRVQMNIGTISTLAPLVREGKLRALAITSAARNHELPDVPTMAESGLPEVASVTYYGLLAPHGVPADAVRRINAAVNDSLKSPESDRSDPADRLRSAWRNTRRLYKTAHERNEDMDSGRAGDRLPK